MTTGIEIALAEIESLTLSQSPGGDRLTLAITGRMDDVTSEDALLDFELCAKNVLDSHVTRQRVGLVARCRRDDGNRMPRLLVRLYDRAGLGIDLLREMF